jgi:hypothetical protein
VRPGGGKAAVAPAERGELLLPFEGERRRLGVPARDDPEVRLQRELEARDALGEARPLHSGRVAEDPVRGLGVAPELLEQPDLEPVGLDDAERDVIRGAQLPDEGDLRVEAEAPVPADREDAPAPLPTANDTPPASSSQPTMWCGSRVTSRAPTVTVGSTTSNVAAANAAVPRPLGSASTSPRTASPSATTQVVHTATACGRPSPARSIVATDAG